MVAIVQLEWYIANTHILSIVINKLGYWQEPCSVILFEVDENSEVGFYRIILLFGLAVYLRIEGSWKSLFDAKKVAEQWPEFWGEQLASIRYN